MEALGNTLLLTGRSVVKRGTASYKEWRASTAGCDSTKVTEARLETRREDDRLKTGGTRVTAASEVAFLTRTDTIGLSRLPETVDTVHEISTGDTISNGLEARNAEERENKRDARSIVAHTGEFFCGPGLSLSLSMTKRS